MKTIKKTLLAAAVASFFSSGLYAQTPIDLGVVNEDKLIEMLVRTGQIPADASDVDKRIALERYLEEKIRSGFKGDAQFGKKALEQRAKILKVIDKQKGPHKARVFALDVGQKRTDKVLALLIDFPDLPWDDNRLTKEHTEMLYDRYEPSHYQDLLFSDKGYTGPNGENFISMRQYYESESGNSYSVSGQAAGWYRASKNAAYYGGNSPGTNNDMNARELVREALDQLARDPNINLADYDIEDRYDYNGNGNFREPDGVIDHLMIFHASVGEEAGGGVLGADAIWSHRFNLGRYHVLEGTKSNVPGRFNGQFAAFDYTIQPIDAAAGVCAHEYGHDLGLPDEYDTQYTGTGEPVSYWSIMSSGSWAGKIGGTQPTAFSSWAKQFLQNSIGGRWINHEQLSINELEAKPRVVTLFQTTDNSRPNMVKVTLPMKRVEGIKPAEGEFSFYSNRGDDLKNRMSRPLTIPAGSQATLRFKAWFQIEKDYDYARVLINGKPIAGNITTMDDPFKSGLVPAISGQSDGWIDAQFDLSAWAGQTVELAFDYLTDGGLAMEGLYVDDLRLEVDGNQTLIDNAEGTSSFAFQGFTKNGGFHEANHYYLLQWRSHNDVDQGLANLKRFGQLMSFEPGLLVWYVDESYADNWVGKHPGEGWLGVVDADQNALIWSKTGEVAQTRFQVRDATFSLFDQAPLKLVTADGNTLEDMNLTANASFSDDQDYSSPQAPDSGRKVMPFGLKIDLLSQSKENEYGVVRLSKVTTENIAPVARFELKVEGLSVTSQNTSSDSDGNIVSYLWDFGNGQTSTEASPTWSYTKAGSYSVTLTVTDDKGDSDTHQQTIKVDTPNALPQASANYIHLGRWVTMWSTSTDSDGRIVDTEWTLPNGKIKRGRMFTAIFPSYGHHDVQLKVMDDRGAVTTTIIKVKL
ncbi:M6 family metalloprotease PrtV [Vibrio cholerae]|uniref:M6 family metalloprotease PrtV n=1 Tax=Vibrio cholerae TaxID=666 RepID=UPI0002C17721|nr:M6 family metalloprotease PrtV [Vibrio cholerae]EKF9853264.1 M6 family metalloprotease PrtV [Vibrio cholerae]EMQ67120.1 putative PrtV [Vibrio cholerae O1 str. NHCC-008D]TXZ05343.1 M6 family metalloprotease domain-containing protein [Vibrio cholerae]GHY20409.1 protease [Vibrio cholerae]